MGEDRREGCVREKNEGRRNQKRWKKVRKEIREEEEGS